MKRHSWTARDISPATPSCWPTFCCKSTLRTLVVTCSMWSMWIFWDLLELLLRQSFLYCTNVQGCCWRAFLKSYVNTLTSCRWVKMGTVIGPCMLALRRRRCTILLLWWAVMNVVVCWWKLHPWWRYSATWLGKCVAPPLRTVASWACTGGSTK